MRTRRLRVNEQMRSLVRETVVNVKDLVYPMFIIEGEGQKNEIPSMPGCFRMTVDELLKEVGELRELGIYSILLFGIPDHKDEVGTGAYCEGNIIARAIQAVKAKYEDVLVIADVCLCEYTDHGHCGVIEDGYVVNDKTLELLAKASVSYALAGADIIAPSDMMDNRVAYIRKALDENGLINVPIMAYSAKYCSSFYGPFRDAADSAPKFGDRKQYQMDPANGREALKEIEEDIREGADMIMVKPALPYLDVICEAKKITNVPVVAYQVSGEYAMIKAADSLGWLNGRRAAWEALTSIKRAGADIIITYFAKEFAKGELQ